MERVIRRTAKINFGDDFVIVPVDDKFPPLFTSMVGDVFLHGELQKLFVFDGKGWGTIGDLDELQKNFDVSYIQDCVKQAKEKPNVLHKPPGKQKLQSLMDKKQQESEW